MKRLIISLQAIAIVFTAALAYEQEDLDMFLMLSVCERCDLSEADLRSANLLLQEISEANFRGANLSGVNARASRFMNVDLRKANLRGADFQYSSIHGSDLRGADFSEADLQIANFSGSQLSFPQIYDLPNQLSRARSAVGLSTKLLFS